MRFLPLLGQVRGKRETRASDARRTLRVRPFSQYNHGYRVVSLGSGLSIWFALLISVKMAPEEPDAKGDEREHERNER